MGIAPTLGTAVLASPTGPLLVPPLQDETDRPFLSLVVPTFNEIENLSDFLTAVLRTLDAALPDRYEVIVVDDDSPDRTWEAAARMAVVSPQLRVVRRCQERGLARAVIRGWQVARGSVLGTINADFQHPPEMLSRMVERVADCDLVVATRHGDGGSLGDWGLKRRVTSWGAGLIGRFLLPEVFARISDPLSGCYLVRRDAIQGVELKPLGYKSLMEVVIRGRLERIRECGYEMRKRHRGKSKVHALHPIQYIRHVFRLRAESRRQRR
ncbi:MAG: polyprenol monophosphomannose synthase [Terriglobia bacterium]|nr:MAG: polyprenol monophosphomannose synthase [Terriglobia bacterium]